jgi:hypothetical protein
LAQVGHLKEKKKKAFSMKYKQIRNPTDNKNKSH